MTLKKRLLAKQSASASSAASSPTKTAQPLRKKKLAAKAAPKVEVAKPSLPVYTPEVILPAKTLKFADSLVVSVRKKIKGSDIKLASDGALLSDVNEWIPTGFQGLDMILGGGWAVGRASEVAGEEGCGKSALAQMACVQVQRMGGLVVYLDFEAALDRSKMERLGLNARGMLYKVPEYIEQGWDIVWSVIERLLESDPDAPTLFVWDSVGGSLAKVQTESSAEEAHVGVVSRAMTPNCMKLFYKIAKCRAHMLFVNQYRASIGKFARFGPPPVESTGGKGLRYAASQRVRCARVSTLKSGGTTGPATGYLIKTTTDKNRLTPPHRKATWVLDFGVGPSPDLTLFESLKDAGKLVSAGAGQYKLRGYDGETVNRSGWSERLALDSELHNHAQALYVALVREGFTAGKVEAEAD